jgi:hypothetical protein
MYSGPVSVGAILKRSGADAGVDCDGGGVFVVRGGKTRSSGRSPAVENRVPGFPRKSVLGDVAFVS